MQRKIHFTSKAQPGHGSEAEGAAVEVQHGLQWSLTRRGDAVKDMVVVA